MVQLAFHPFHMVLTPSEVDSKGVREKKVNESGREDHATLVELKAEAKGREDPQHWVCACLLTPSPHNNNRQGIWGEGIWINVKLFRGCSIIEQNYFGNFY